MTRIEQSIEVNVPAHTVYNQLTQFEDYPRFMEDVEEVRQLDDTHLHWRAKMNSHDMEWDAEIVEQVPDQLIAWRNMGGRIKAEKVEVRPLEQDKAKVMMTIEYEPQEVQAQQGDVETEIAEHAVHDLVRFKRFIESRGRETGAWRGEVRQGQEVKPGDGAGAQQAGGQQAGGPSAGQQPAGQQAAGQQQAGGEQAQGREQQAAGQQQAGGEQAQGREQQAGGQQAKQQPGGRQASGQISGSGQQGMQGAEQDPMTAAMTSMNPQSWLPNILHAWEEPFVMMRKMTEDMDQIFERFVGRPMYGAKPTQAVAGPVAWSPPLEIAQRDNQLVVRADLPGVRQEDVHVEIKNDRLVIEGDRRDEQQAQGQGYRRSERSYGHFYRAIALPEGASPEQASASMRDGVLEITMPVRQVKQQGRQLDIRSSS
jgi:HSP20 family molecular chaperone IbpA/ribosome-associated toxin RatA of RatAB toxin-antitoxin module